MSRFPISRYRRREWSCLALILLTAAFLRFYRLDSVPPGLTHDEAGNGQSAMGVLEGDRPLYFTIGNGREPLYAYSMAPVVALLGPTEIAVRLTSVLWGLALILVTWAWAREAFDPLTALLTAVGLSVGFWPLMISRLGLRAVTLPVLFIAAIHCLWRAAGLSGGDLPAGTRSRAWLCYLLTGLLLGASFYTYMASRVLPVVLLLFLLYLALVHRQRARSTWRGILAALVVAVVVAAPLLLYLRAHPGVETRIGQLSQPWREAQAGNWGPLRQNLIAALKIFTFNGAGDPHWIYNLSGRPLLDPLSGLLFYAGLLLAVWRWRDPAHFFILVWLAVGMAPVYVTGANSSVVRAVAIQPVVYLMQALALRKLLQRCNRGALRLACYALSGMALLIIAMIAFQAYFVRWPDQRDVRVAYHTTLVEIARYLDAQPEGGTGSPPAVAPSGARGSAAEWTAAISSIYPGFFHDPYSFDLTSHREDLAVRWFDGRSALVFPDVDQAWAVFPALAPLGATLTPLFAPYAGSLERVTLRADDLNPWFEVYRWRPRAAVDHLPLTPPVDVGHVVAFVGYQLGTASVAPGGTVELLTFWRVLDVASIDKEQELVFFTHVLDGNQQVVGQQDRLDVPAWNWSPGDGLVQLHRFALQSDLPDGLYPLEIGVYTRAPDYPRLPVYTPGKASGTSDRILLPPLEVRAP